jgi:hypothetical protein
MELVLARQWRHNVHTINRTRFLCEPLERRSHPFTSSLEFGWRRVFRTSGIGG